MQMNEPIFIQQLEEKLKKPLPGAKAHEPLRATPIGLVKPKFEHKLPPKPGSVLILLYQEGATFKFPLTKRQEYIGAHSGQISLPGGKAEAGEDAIETALREAEEEIGIIRKEVRVIGKLTDFFVIPSNFMVTPVVAYAKQKPLFALQISEVDRIVEVDMQKLIHEDAVKTKEILAANIYPMMAPHFEIEGEIVWGATAMMLNELRVVIQSIK
jgi:8-oxo-dGTP pyrophosphatase MutT (NUDIX family)